MTGGVGATTPVWFGPIDAPLLGWWELPPGPQARGAVVICPSMAQEHTSAYRTLRILAERLAARDLAVLRFDYAGTGDSADQSGPDRVPAWLESVRAAVEHAGQVTAGPVAAVGVRLGALLLAAAVASRDVPLAAAVLLDPPASGRAWLRRQAALQRMAFGPRDAADGSTELPGVALPSRTAEALAALPGVEALESSVVPTLRLTAEESALTRLFDVEPAQARVPADLVDGCVDWLDAALPRAPAGPLRRPTAADASAAPAPGIRETVGRVGPRAVAAVTSHREGSNRSPAGTVVFLGASDHRVGPARQWVSWSRQCAARGLRAVRLDVGGTGDGARHGEEIELCYYTEDAVDDAVTAVRAIEPDPSRVTVIGLCAGAWTAMRAAETGCCARVVLVNQLIWARPAANLGPDGLAAGGEAYHDSRSKRLRGRVRTLLPAPVARLLDEVGLTNSPIARLARLSRAGVDVTVVLAEGEVAGFHTLTGPDLDAALAPGAGWRWLLRRRGGLRVVVVEEMDHAMLTVAGRRAADRVVVPILAGDAVR